jgi:hypothetical protein
MNEAKSRGFFTAFLCHSHRDTEFVKGLVATFHQAGWNVYVDWADPGMPDTPNRETAQRIREKIVQADFFIFLATPHSVTSRWCPWEIGYADGTKQRIIVVPTRDGASVHGNEYLELYEHVEFDQDRHLRVWQPGQPRGGILLESLGRRP